MNAITFWADEYCDAPATSALDTFEGISITHEQAEVERLRNALNIALIAVLDAQKACLSTHPQATLHRDNALSVARRSLVRAL